MSEAYSSPAAMWKRVIYASLIADLINRPLGEDPVKGMISKRINRQIDTYMFQVCFLMYEGI